MKNSINTTIAFVDSMLVEATYKKAGETDSSTAIFDCPMAVIGIEVDRQLFIQSCGVLKHKVKITPEKLEETYKVIFKSANKSGSKRVTLLEGKENEDADDVAYDPQEVTLESGETTVRMKGGQVNDKGSGVKIESISRKIGDEPFEYLVVDKDGGKPTSLLKLDFTVVKFTVDPFVKIKGLPLQAGVDENVIENPAAIIIGDPAARLIATMKPKPGELTLEDELEWLPEDEEGAAIGDANGLKPEVKGEKAGRAKLQLRLKNHEDGDVFEFYEVVVRELQQLPVRINFIGYQADHRNANPAGIRSVQTHLKIANAYLRQAGVKLVLDADDTLGEQELTDGKPVPMEPKGYFKVRAEDRVHTVGVTSDLTDAATTLNAKEGVVNINYMLSLSPIDVLGRNAVRPANSLAPSFKATYRLKAEEDPVEKTYLLFEADSYKKTSYYGVCLNKRGSGQHVDRKVGAVLAHEIGHLLNLRHAGPDKIKEDGIEGRVSKVNLMTDGRKAGTTVIQDLDLIQVLAVEQSGVKSIK